MCPGQRPASIAPDHLPVRPRLRWRAATHPVRDLRGFDSVSELGKAIVDDADLRQGACGHNAHGHLPHEPEDSRCIADEHLVPALVKGRLALWVDITQLLPEAAQRHLPAAKALRPQCSVGHYGGSYQLP